jgi:exodeoxyribonuclease VII large subunit
MEPESINVVTYSPAAVLNLFNNSISISQTKRLIQLKGIFQPGKGGLYSGYYYDNLRDESSDAQITIIVPALIRSEMQANKTITVNGFITKRVVNNASRIDIQLTVTELAEQGQNKYSDEDIKRITLLQTKAAVGFKDVHGFIKDRIINEQSFKIGVVIGKTGIIDNDIKHQLRESIGFYALSFHRISLSSESEIIAAMDELDHQNYDLIVISRGGGENLDIFNKLAIAEKSISLKALFVTAIGHKNDVTLLQQLADKAFITPSEFGQFLNDTYNNTIEEAQHSKAKLVESVKIELAANYQKQIENLNEKLKGVEELKLASQTLQNEKLIVLNDQIQAYKTQISTLENKPAINWLVVIIAVVIGVVIGYLLKHF